MTGASSCRINGLSVMKLQLGRSGPADPPALLGVEAGLTIALTPKAPPMLCSKLTYQVAEWPPHVLELAQELIEAVEQTLVQQSGLFTGMTITRDPSILEALPKDD